MPNKSKLGFGIIVTTALSAALVGAAEARSVTVRQILSDYTLVTSGNATTSSDIEGSAVVGGALNAATFFNASSSGAALASPSITFFGSLTNRNGLNIEDRNASSSAPTLYYDGKISTNTKGIPSTQGQPPVNFKGRSTLAPVPADLTISDFTTPLDALQSVLSGMQATKGSSISYSANSLVFHVGAPIDDVVVFDLPLSVLNGKNGNLNPVISFAGDLAGADTTIVVNVTGGSSFNESGAGVNFNPTAYEDEHVIWNFAGFTSLSFTQWGGAVLAGDADVTNSSPINGFVYAAGFRGNGELHYYPFEGVLPADGQAGSSATLAGAEAPLAAPELSTWAMLAAGFAALGFAGFRRRRSSIAAAL